MLAFVVRRLSMAAAARRYTTVTELHVGRHRDNHVILDDERVSDRHARIVCSRGKYVLADLNSKTGTLRNDQRIRAPVILAAGDCIVVGDFAIATAELDETPLAERDEVTVIMDPVERAFVTAIEAGDRDGRGVYADWLEERGDLERATFLRLQDRVGGMTPKQRSGGTAAEFRTASAELMELASRVPATWRARVGTRPIEHCDVAFDLRCPKQWGSLTPTDRADVRHCSACARDVFYCTSVLEARTRAATGACIAIDPAAARWKSDLAAPYDRWCYVCNVEVGALQACPRCGNEIGEEMVMGLMA